MPKSLKIALLCVVGAPLILIIGVVLFFTFNDANNFKPSIENQAKERAGINLEINGKLSWSLLPLGININKLALLDQDKKLFASAKQIIAQIDLISILTGNPRIETVLIDGLQLNLIQTSDTQANWLNVIPSQELTEKPANDTGKPDTYIDSGTTSNNTGHGINFLVESFELKNTQIQFRSTPANIDLTINPLNLLISNIALDQSIPLSLDFKLSEKTSDFTLESSLSGQIYASKDLNEISIKNLSSQHQVNSPTMGSKTIPVLLDSDIAINTNTERVELSDLTLQVSQLTLLGQALINDYSQKLSVDAKVDIPTFSLQDELQLLAINPPKMQHAKAMNKLALSTHIKLNDGQLNLQKLKLQIDDNTWTGNLGYHLDNQALTAIIAGDTLNIDHYLPPAKNSQTVKTSATVTNTDKESPAELIPLEIVRNLNLDIQFQQQSLIASNIETRDVDFHITANKGLVSLNKLNGKLNEGSYSLTAALDASKNTPRWSGQQKIQNMALQPLLKSLDLKQLQDYGKISGTLDLSATENANGNTIESLLESIDANAHLELAIKTPEMKKPVEVKKVAIATDIKLKGQKLALQNMKLKVDKSTWSGDLSYHLESQALTATIAGDTLNLDQYLPPVEDSQRSTSQAGAAEKTKTTKISSTTKPVELIPLETARKLDLDIRFKQQKLSARKIETNDIDLHITAKKGLLSLKKLNGKLYQGSYSLNAAVDARKTTPLWSGQQTIKGIALGPLIKALSIQQLDEYGTLSGKLNLNASGKTKGNTAEMLTQKANINSDFNIQDGIFEGLSLNTLTCEGFSLINRDKVDTSEWPNSTHFKALKGKATLKQQVLDSQFDIITSGLNADSNGTINLLKSEIDISASLKVVGNMGEHACRVNDKIKSIAIPVKCQGSFDAPPAELCTLDKSKLTQVAKEAAVTEGKRKINKEIDRALNKHLGEDTELNKNVKNLLKGLF